MLRVVLFILQLLLAVLKSAHTANFEFTSPDIVVETTLNGTKLRLEAFKSLGNDPITQNRTKEEYSRLHWVSLGFPRLIATPLSKNSSENRLFSWSSAGFYASVETLNEAHKDHLKEKIHRQYKLNVSTAQIASLTLEKFEYRFKLECLGNQSNKSVFVEFTGKVDDPQNIPLRVNFQFSSETQPFKECVKSQVIDSADLDIKLACDLAKKSSLPRDPALIITSEQLSQFNFTRKILGTSTQKFMTRTQFDILGAEFSLFEGSNLLSDFFARQALDALFRQTDFYISAKSLSAYGFGFKNGDFNVSEFAAQFSQILRVDESLILVDEENVIKLLLKTPTSFAIAEKSINFVRLGQKVLNKSLLVQLEELNNASVDHLQWTLDGTKVVPKSLNVANVNETLLSDQFRIVNYTRQMRDYVFERKITLNTKRNESRLNSLIKSTFVEGWYFFKLKYRAKNNNDCKIDVLRKIIFRTY